MATRGKKEKEYPPMPANWMYKRGDVYMMDLNPYSGSEQGGIRPAIVVQNDDGNFYSNVLLVVPLTTQIKKRNMPTHFILHNRFLSAPSMVICESPRPADKSRVLSYLGTCPNMKCGKCQCVCNTALGSLDTSHSENTLRLLRRRMFSPLQKSCSLSSFKIFGC